MDHSPYFHISGDIQRALTLGLPIVALESTVITHGLPSPYNLSLARDMEAAVREEGANPATIAVLSGVVHVGVNDLELEALANDGGMKISLRDFAAASLKKANGGTTVAGTLFAAEKAGIRVFATGGIGGVHKENPSDISPDLQALASTPVIVVCAGAKSILNLPATLEYLETMGVPVLGYETDDFPAFFSRQSGLKLGVKVESAEEVASFAKAHWGLGMRSAILVCQPLSSQDELPHSEIDPIEEAASKEAIAKKISGQALTPFLLQRINEMTGGRSMSANLSLLLNNAHLAARIAKALPSQRKVKAV